MSRMITARVSGAFNEQNPRNAREPEKILPREYQRSLDETVQKKFVPLWVDLRNPGVVTLEMESGRGDNPVQVLQGSPACSGAWSRGFSEITRGCFKG